VYCLSPAQRGAIVQAAIALGLAGGDGTRTDHVVVDGNSISVETWRKDRQEQFVKTCRALRPAPAPAPSTVIPALFALLNVLVGATIGYVSATLRDRVGRYRAQARALRSATASFVAAAGAYARSWTDGSAARPSDLAVQSRRVELATELRAVQADHPGSDAKGILEQLDGALNEEVFRNWRPADTETVTDATNALKDVEKRSGHLVRAIERPWRKRAELRDATVRETA
jgi:hypothetical protein